MFNPNMFNQMQGQLPQLPSQADLWKDEKSKYRHWMILFFLGICAVMTLMIVGLVMMTSNRDAIVASQVKEIMTGSDYKIVLPGPDGITGNADDVFSTDTWLFYGKQYNEAGLNNLFNSSFTSSFIISPSINIGFIGIGVLLFVASLFESYKVKSFAKLSSWPTFVIGFSAFMAFFSLLSFSWNHADAFVSDGAILIFVANLSTLIVYFGGGMQVSRIRKQFVMSARIEAMKNNPQFQAAQQQFGNMMGGMNNGAFAPQNMAPQGQQQPPVNPVSGAVAPQPGQQAAPVQPAQPVQPAVPTEKQKLEAMSLADLKTIAKKLSISGYKDMKKDELIQAILRIHEGSKK